MLSRESRKMKVMSDTVSTKGIPEGKKEVVKNLYLSGIGVEFIAMQLDMEIPVVIAILREFGEYKID